MIKTKFNRVANDSTAHEIVRSLEIIPQNIKKLTDESGLQIYCFNENFKPSKIGLISAKASFSDKRFADETSAFYAEGNTIYFFDEDVYFPIRNKEKAFSTIIHEYAHALDHAISLKNGMNCYYNSCGDNFIRAGWENGKALDCYADINPAEYFAQAFMAYFNDLVGYKPWSYREHTRLELKERDRDMFDYFNVLCGSRR